MKINTKLILSIVLIIIVSAAYRVYPSRTPGFAPQLAIALFSGIIFANNKKWAFALPIASLLISDIIYEIMYRKGMTMYKGFYDGQIYNYLLFALVTSIGFFVKRINVQNIFASSLIAPTVFFIGSNFVVWAGSGGYNRPRTFAGLTQTFVDGLLFYRVSIEATVFFSVILFGAYRLATNYITKKSWDMADSK